MSIINDALKKAGNNNSSFQPNLTELKSRENDSGKNWLIWAGVGLLSLVGILIVINSFKGPAYTSVKQPGADNQQGARFNLRAVDFEAPLNNAGFQLSGILYDPQNPMAIVNNRIVDEGAFIDGAQLLEIQPNFVKLSFRGQELTLVVK
ncbi:hypothetical protein ACFL1I_07700 [Candidatus Omnitrophota bacterium]